MWKSISYIHFLAHIKTNKMIASSSYYSLNLFYISMWYWTRLTLHDMRYFLVDLTWGGGLPGKHSSGTFIWNGQNSFSVQNRLKNEPKISNFKKISNDLKNVSRHSGGHHNIKIKHFEHFWGGLLESSPSICPSDSIIKNLPK